MIPPARPRVTVGWREWLSLPELGIARIRAKIDSGARSSSLHVQEHQLFEREDKPWVRFVVELGDATRPPRQVEAEVIDQRIVTDSGGHRASRVFICTALHLPDGQHWPIEINLTPRRNMSFPMLLGRTALRRRCVVEPARSFLLGLPPDPDA